VSATQLSLLEPVSALPEGFVYRPELVTPEREVELIEHFEELDFREFEFQGYLGKRRVVSFGLNYDFAERRVHQAAEIPAFLLPLRDRAAGFAGISAAALEHALVTEYTPGAAIGWHRDRPVFQDVVGVSFGSPCRFRFRRKQGSGWERASLILESRSAYLLRGPARHQWEHSIPPAEALRYSVTFRSVKSPAASAGR
jgi:alkylated DNA repair dioxygenase AlkB